MSKLHLKLYLKTTLLAISLFIGTVIFFIWYAINSDQNQADIIKEFTMAERTFKYNDLGWQGQKEQYRKLMMRIFRVYSKAYNSRDVRTLSPKEKPEYIDLCFDLAKDLGQPLSEWHGPIFGILESALNPNALGDYTTKKALKKDKKGNIIGEKIIEVPSGYGMYQIRLSCGLAYKNFYGMQQDWFKKKYPINYEQDTDALNWRTSTILLYCGMWGAYNKIYQGNHHFAISSHRFGPILERFFDNGQGKLPETLTYLVDGGKIVFKVSEYWISFLGMKECFEAGKIELGEPFRIKWDGVRKEIALQEKEFTHNFKKFKYFKNEIEKLKLEKNSRDKRILELEKDIDDTYAKFVKAYGDIHAGNYKSVKTVFKSARGIVRSWMKQYDESKKWRYFISIILFFLIVLLAMVIQYYLIKFAIIGFKSRR